MIQVWALGVLLHARDDLAASDLTTLYHVHDDGTMHPSSVDGDVRRCDHCGNELRVTSCLEKMLDLIDALNSGQLVTAVIFTMRLDRSLLEEMAQATPTDIALRTIELEEGVELDHPLALAAA